nr:hypothetical protein CFP56_53658 [Quercus suber]
MSDYQKTLASSPQGLGYNSRDRSSKLDAVHRPPALSHPEIETVKVVSLRPMDEPALSSSTACEEATRLESSRTAFSDSEDEDPEDAALVARTMIGRSEVKLPVHQPQPVCGSLLARQAVVRDAGELGDFTFKEATRPKSMLNKTQNSQRLPKSVATDVNAHGKSSNSARLVRC